MKKKCMAVLILSIAMTFMACGETETVKNIENTSINEVVTASVNEEKQPEDVKIEVPVVELSEESEYPKLIDFEKFCAKFDDDNGNYPVEVMAHDEDKNVTLYACGVENYILQIEDEYWMLEECFGFFWPSLGVSDFDGDGEDEYAITYLAGRGTGVSITGLSVFQKKGDELIAWRLDTDGLGREFTECNEAVFDEEYRYATVAMSHSGYDSKTTISIPEGYNVKMPMERFYFGDICSIDIVQDEIWVTMTGGYTVTETPSPCYEPDVKAKAKLIFHDAGYISVENVCLESMPNYYEDNIVPAYIGGLKADINHDDFPENIELLLYSFADDGEYKNVYEALEYESCRVKATIEYDDLTDTIWQSREYSQVHMGNGDLILVHHDGRDYLMTLDLGLSQGSVFGYYELFFTSYSNYNGYIVASGMVSFDANDENGDAKLAAFGDELFNYLDEDDVLIVGCDINNKQAVLSYDDTIVNAREFVENQINNIKNEMK